MAEENQPNAAANEAPKAEAPATPPPAADAAAPVATPPPASTEANAAPAADSAPADPGVTESATDAKGEPIFDNDKLNILNDVFIALSIEIGRAQIKIRDLLKLSKGSIIELDKLASEPVDIYANGKLIALGNIITANGKYCVRLTSINEKNKSGAQPDGK